MAFCPYFTIGLAFFKFNIRRSGVTCGYHEETSRQRYYAGRSIILSYYRSITLFGNLAISLRPMAFCPYLTIGLTFFKSNIKILALYILATSYKLLVFHLKLLSLILILLVQINLVILIYNNIQIKLFHFFFGIQSISIQYFIICT